ncbi:unnamed protein product [Adineta ricciae]|uniref:Reverse transcriptase domain-containing protein n=1 Tax=Adineta ricciae TaxID=249248 RepID=A0A816BIW2_ADIRI|nr:unnamed protein product [Adineta ricciae]
MAILLLTLAGDSVSKILRIQLINPARKLLNTADVFAFFQVESEEIDDLKKETCFKSKNGLYFVKPGVQTGLSKLTSLLQQRIQEDKLSTDKNNDIQQSYITDQSIDKHPLLKSLIQWYRLNDSKSCSENNALLIALIDNLVINLTQSSNNYRYSVMVKKFATCIYIIGGKQCYEFIRLNLPGILPNLTSINDFISQSSQALNEAEFKFHSLQQFQSGFGFCSEDTTGVIRKVEYDSSTNSFAGFATSIIDGIPSKKYYQSETFDDLKSKYDASETAGLLNVHMFQSISTASDPTNVSKSLLLSAYGVNNKISSIDILRRWAYIFENCLNYGTRIIGFSTDPIHLVTKWRNRLLSPTAKLRFGDDIISMVHIEKLLNNNDFTRLDHDLIKDDVNPKDRQNYKSCIKLISDDVINLLNGVIDANGTIVYLTLLKMIVKAYIDRSKSIHELVNFTVRNFLRRSQKLAILNEIKYDSSEKDLRFPIHHKHKREDFSLTPYSQLDDIDTLDIEQIVLDAKFNLDNMNALSQYVFDVLRKNSKMINYSSPIEIDSDQEFGLDEENEDNDETNGTQDDIDESQLDFENESLSDDDGDILNSIKSGFDGIRIYDRCNSTSRQSYFKVKINGNINSKSAVFSLLKTLVVFESQANILGRDCIKALQLLNKSFTDRKDTTAVCSMHSSLTDLQEICTQYKEIFGDQLGCSDFSKWAAPIVAVPKPGEKARICADFSTGINQAIDIDQYPLPRPDDLFAVLNGGKFFSKISFSEAYLQVPMEETSKNTLVINTHKGLYRYNRLPFGIASAPSIFQKLVDTMLSGLYGTVAYLDDIIVTGCSELGHLKNFLNAFARIQDFGFKINKQKCSFLQSEVEYLGFVVNSDGIHTSTSKTAAIREMPQPSNVSQLKSFLGMVNHYAKFIPHLAS